MSSNIATLAVNLLADTADFSLGMLRAAAQSDKLRQNLVEGARMGGAAIAGLGIAALAVAAPIAALVRQSIDAADGLADMAARTGVSVEKLSAFTYGLHLGDANLETLQKGLIKLSATMTDAGDSSSASAKMFAQLGVSAYTASGTMRASEDVVADIAEKFADMEDGAAKSEFAMALFGKAGVELIPTLNMGREGLKEAADEAQRLGLVLSTEVVEAAGQFNDTMDTAKFAVDGLSNELMAAALPSLQAVASVLLDVAKETIATAQSFDDLAAKQTSFASFGESVGGVFAFIADAALNVINLFKVVGEGIALMVVQAQNGAQIMAKAAVPGGVWTNRQEIAALYKESGHASIEYGKRVNGLMLQSNKFREANAAFWSGVRGDIQKNANLRYLAAEDAAAGMVEHRGKKNTSGVPGKTSSGGKPAGGADKEKDAINQMLRRIEVENQSTEVQKVAWEIEKGRYKDFSDASQKQLLALAQRIDLRTDEKKRIEDQIKEEEKLVEVMKRSAEVVDSMRDNLQRRREEEQFQASLYGKSSLEKDRAYAARDVAETARGAQEALQRMYEDGAMGAEAYRAKLAEVQAAQAEYTRLALETVDANHTMATSWGTGLSEAINRYVEEANDGAKAAASMAETITSGMETMFMDFFTKGKADWRAFANSIITEILRIQVKKMVAGIVGGIGGDDVLGGGLLGSIFGGARANGGPVSAGQTYLVGERGPELFSPTAAGRIIPNGGFGGGGVSSNVTVIVNNDGSVSGENNSGEGNAKQLGDQLRGLVVDQLIKEKRPGGLLAA